MWDRSNLDQLQRKVKGLNWKCFHSSCEMKTGVPCQMHSSLRNVREARCSADAWWLLQYLRNDHAGFDSSNASTLAKSDHGREFYPGWGWWSLAGDEETALLPRTKSCLHRKCTHLKLSGVRARPLDRVNGCCMTVIIVIWKCTCVKKTSKRLDNTGQAGIQKNNLHFTQTGKT